MRHVLSSIFSCRLIFLIMLTCGLVACSGRALTEAETAFLSDIHGGDLDIKKVRLIDGAPTRAVTFRRAPRPRVTCQENILPPATGEIVTAKPAAVTIFNSVLFDKDWFLDDYVPKFPNEIDLIAAMLFAHEMTHVWQWQNRARTKYHPLKAAAEHNLEDPYLFDLDNAPKFLDFGYEQQGSIVEEYVCCRALAPQAARTHRLHALISQEMPLTPLPQSRPHDVRLPWDGVELNGICD